MNLQFTYKSSIHYLDITLTGDETKRVIVSPFIKPMSRNTISLATSCHPSHVTRNILVGELIRAKRNCTVYEREQKNICSRLKSRNYPQWSLNRAVDKVAHIGRPNLLKETQQAQRCDHKVAPITFSTTYSPQYRKILAIQETLSPSHR